MKINKITAESFGKLKNKNIELSPGINVIEGANESGKSTVARFLRFMLYGFTSRASEISKNDKKKYLPWDESVCKGTLEISAGGENYTVRREQTARASHSITDADGVPVFKGMTAGEAFLGVDDETFDKTALISGGDVYFDNAVSLSSAIKNMVFSADSEVDSESALKKLDALRRSILGKTERSGSLYEARLELAELSDRKNSLAEAHRELLGAQHSVDKITANIEKNCALIETLTAEKNNIEAFEALQLCGKINEQREKAEKSRALYERKCLELTIDGFLPDREYLSRLNETAYALKDAEKNSESARNELYRASDELKNCYADSKQLKFNEILAQSGKTAVELKNDAGVISSKLKLHKKLAVLFTCLIITIPIAVFMWLGCSKMKKKLALLAEKFGCDDISEFERRIAEADRTKAAAETAQKRKDTASAALEQAEKMRAETVRRLSELLEKSGTHVSDTSDIYEVTGERIKTLGLEIASIGECGEQMKIDEASFSSLMQSVGDCNLLREKAQTYNPELPLREKAKVEMELGFYSAANEKLAQQKIEYEKKAAVISANMEQPDELSSKIAVLENRIAELELAHSALVMASEAIEGAHGAMRGNVSPILTRNASELFSLMTGGKYVGLYVDDELKISFLEDGSSEYRSVDYLSSGAADAAYLALRITLIQYLYSESPTLIFDDAFSKLDGERLKNVCRCIEKLSEKYQIIILTCHSREAETLGTKSIMFG